MPKSCIQDRTLLEDPEIFAKYLHGLGHMALDIRAPEGRQQFFDMVSGSPAVAHTSRQRLLFCVREGTMRGSTAGLAGLLVLLSGSVDNPALAQEKAGAKAGAATLKELAKNEKVRAYETIFKPGDEAPSIERPLRVVRALSGGTLELTYPDGKKETSQYKTGEVKIRERATYGVKNVGKTTVHLYIVQVL